MAFCSTARPEKRTSCQVPVPELSEPGACSINCDIWRPLTGRFFTSRSLTFTPRRAELRAIAAVSPLTVTVSLTPAGCNCRSSADAWDGGSGIPVYWRGAELAVGTVIVYMDVFRRGTAYV